MMRHISRINRKRHDLSLWAFRCLVMVMVCACWASSYAQVSIIKPPEKKVEPKKPPVVVTPPVTPPKKPQKPVTPTKPVTPPKPAVVHTARWAVDQLRKNMVKIEGGTFMMGVPLDNDAEEGEDNQPAHQVTLKPFFIGKYEVTEEEWKVIMGADPSDDSNGKYTSTSCPVDNVDWNDCQVFIAKLKELTGLPFRLPTEAEWEFAARGGNADLPYAGSADIDDCGWYVSNSNRVKHPVGQKRPNGYGLYDMTGNVREWCSDFYHEKYYADSPADNPMGPLEGSLRVIRGGCFNNQKNACEVTYRAHISPESKNKFLGLRLACSVEETNE